MRARVSLLIAFAVVAGVAAWTAAGPAAPSSGAESGGAPGASCSMAAEAACGPARPGGASLAAAAGAGAASGAGSAALASGASGPLDAPDAAGAPAGEALNADQFAELARETLRKLPTAIDMQSLTAEEAHGYPVALAKAGSLLGRMAEAVEAQPALEAQANAFYAECSQDAAILTPVRALCYSHVLRKAGAPQASRLPAEVVRLALLIPQES